MRFFRIRPNHFLTLTHTCVVIAGSKSGSRLYRTESNALPRDDFTRRWDNPDVENEILGKQKDFSTYLAKPCFMLGSHLLNPAGSFSQSPHDRVNKAK